MVGKEIIFSKQLVAEAWRRKVGRRPGAIILDIYFSLNRQHVGVAA
jgi:hypothetical protein